MGNAVVDTSQWPLVHVRWPKSMDSFDTLVGDFDELLSRGEPFVLEFDIRGANRPAPALRQAIAEFQKSRHDLLARWVLGFAFVVDNSVLRGALTAIRWMVPAAYPEAHFPSSEPARRWLEKQLTASGVSMSRVPKARA